MIFIMHKFSDMLAHCSVELIFLDNTTENAIVIMPRRENIGKKEGKKGLDFKPMTSSLNYSTLCPLSFRNLLLTVAPEVMFYTDVQISAISG